MAIQTASARSSPKPVPVGTILAKSIHKNTAFTRIAARKKIAKDKLKKIINFAKFFIDYRERVAWERAACKTVIKE